VKLAKDAVSVLTLPPGKSETEVWDDDIPGFGIRLRPHSTQWIFRYRRGGRQRRITIGAVSAISAAQARAIAARLYARVKLGEDPAGDRAETLARASDTFERALRPYLVHKQAELRPGSFESVNRHLLKHAAPLHRLELAQAAERRRVAALLMKIATSRGPVEARSTKSSLSGFFCWAIGQGLLEGSDPCVGIPNAPINGPRMHVPSDADMVKILRALPQGDFGDIILLLTYTLCRKTEIGSLGFDEVNFGAGLIELPAHRTKSGVARSVPMSTPVRRILERRAQIADGTRGLIFGTGQGGFSGWSKPKRMLDQRAGVSGWTIHDIRRYGSSTMNHEGIALPFVVEAALGHAVGDRISRIYNLTTYQEQVRAALELWATRTERLISGELEPAKVLPLRRRKDA
jgi:integrase